MRRFWFCIHSLIIIGLASCASPKKKVFYAFTDGFTDWYKLELYTDSTFKLHIPIVDYSGRYKLAGDTILFIYTAPNDSSVKQTPPAAYLIDRQKEKIEELALYGNQLQRRKDVNNWMQIVENKLTP